MIRDAGRPVDMPYAPSADAYASWQLISLAETYNKECRPILLRYIALAGVQFIHGPLRCLEWAHTYPTVHLVR